MERPVPRGLYPASRLWRPNLTGATTDRHLRLRNVVLMPSAPISNPGPGRRRRRASEGKDVLPPSDSRDDDEYAWGSSRPTATRNTARGLALKRGRLWRFVAALARLGGLA